MNYERLFQILAVVMAAVAAFLLWRNQTEAMFVAGVIGTVAFFLSIRMQVKNRLAQRSTDVAEDNDTYSSTE